MSEIKEVIAKIKTRNTFEDDIIKLLQDRADYLILDFNNPEIDSITKQIIERFIDAVYNFDPLFILEVLTHLGYAPNLLYDDDGDWAVTCGGYQSVQINKEEDYNAHSTFIVSKKYWKSTPQEAVEYFIKNFYSE